MTAEQKVCQSCKDQFIIEPEDFEFYKKLAVPPPLFCPTCRLKRRSVFRNERTLYKRKCNLCGKGIVSMYGPKSPYTVYCIECYESDAWDPYSYGAEYDPKTPFFDQLKRLFEKVPKQAMYLTGANVNSEYTNYAGPDDKNCYLIFNSGKCEESLYSRGLKDCKYTVDSYFGTFLEDCYEVVNGQQSARLLFGQNVVGSVDSMLLLNCSGLQNCFGCVNLRHKSYCWFNEQLSKEDYEKRINEIRGSYARLEEAKKKFQEFSLQFPRRANTNMKSIGVVGDYVFESRNMHECFEAANCENCKYTFFSKGAKDSYDTLGYGFNSELLLNTASVGYSSRIVSSASLENCRDIAYSFSLKSSQDCIGCDGLRNGQFCILNTRYSQDEYEALREQIVGRLRQDGSYGEFFPPRLAFFAYNEAIGQDNIPLTQEQSEKEGFRWEEDFQITKGTETLGAVDVPDNIADVSDSITSEVLACRQCGRNYKIIPSELLFYRRMKLALPRECFNCRHEERLRRRGPFTLFHRNCAHCGKSIQTNFAPERPEIVYCEGCYQAEVI